MAAEIKTQEISGTNITERWAIMPKEYEMTVTKLDGTRETQHVDFQDLMVGVAEQRAATLEEEVKPMAKRIQARNVKLEQIGRALSQLSSVSANFKSDEPNPSASASFTIETVAIIHEAYRLAGQKGPYGTGEAAFSGSTNKSTVDEATQKLKTWSEKLNNDSQLNMSRMQNLIDNRDQSYNAATTMMNHISETRGFTIKSMN